MRCTPFSNPLEIRGGARRARRVYITEIHQEVHGVGSVGRFARRQRSVLHRPHSLGQRIPAKLSGTITVCDYASTNKLVITNLDNIVPDDEFVLSIGCIQHTNGTSVEVTTKLFDLFCQTYCSEGLFKRGDFADDLMTEARAICARGLFVGNAESTSPEQPGDASYARSLLEMCLV